MACHIAAVAGVKFEQELEVQAGIQQEEADAQAAAAAASSGSGLWGEISDVVSTAATVTWDVRLGLIWGGPLRNCPPTRLERTRAATLPGNIEFLYNPKRRHFGLQNESPASPRGIRGTAVRSVN
jgi:hypothetical protein